jgi:hypothetical protein
VLDLVSLVFHYMISDKEWDVRVMIGHDHRSVELLWVAKGMLVLSATFGSSTNACRNITPITMTRSWNKPSWQGGKADVLSTC